MCVWASKKIAEEKEMEDIDVIYDDIKLNGKLHTVFFFV